MSYQVHGMLYDNRNDAINALVEAFLTAGGLNDESDVREAQKCPGQTADELLEYWPAELTGAQQDMMTGEWDAGADFATREELVDAIQSYKSGT